MTQFFDAFIGFLSTYFNIPIVIFTAFLALFGITGCAELEKQQMSQSAKVVAEKVGDAVAAGIENGIRDVQATASVQGINPGYDFRMKVTVGTVVDVDGHIGLSGVAGQMSINAASGRDTSSDAKVLSNFPPGSRILETICIPPEPECEDEPAAIPQTIAAVKGHKQVTASE